MYNPEIKEISHFRKFCLQIDVASELQFAVKMNANRLVVGTLRGFDQFMNLVVDNTVEVNGNEKTDIGMVVRVILQSNSSLCLFA